MSGVDSEKCEPFQQETILKQVLAFGRSQKDKPETLVRVFILLLVYYDVPEKTYRQLLGILNENSVYGQALVMVRKTILVRSQSASVPSKLKRHLPALDRQPV